MKKILIATLLLAAMLCYAVPANPQSAVTSQPDGTTLTIRKAGDERISYTRTADGYTLLKNRAGIYEYARLENGRLALSGIKASDAEVRSRQELSFLAQTAKNLTLSTDKRAEVLQKSRMPQIRYNAGLAEINTSRATKKILVILMNFKDKSFTKSKADFQNLMNTTGYTADGATGSFKDYYLENSYGQLTFETTVVGPYTANNNISYYGANDANGYDLKPEELIKEAINKANPDVNYADYDNNSDGVVDLVYVVYAGYGEENADADANWIWAHNYYIPDTVLDGKTINNYSTSAELRGISGTGISRIGVICHEFGHAIGAPDFYDTDNPGESTEYPGTGEWDLMCSGSWCNDGVTPAHHNPWTKIYCYGWATAVTISNPATLTLSNAAQNSASFYRFDTQTANEYYLLENRQQTGFDAYLPGHGLLIYRADGNYINSHLTDNSINNGSHQGFYPMAANHTVASGISYYNQGASPIYSAGCPFPGTSSKKSFTDATVPSSKSWAGANTAKPITNVTENSSAKTVTFDFMGGSSTTLDPEPANYPTAFTAAAITDNSITVGWTDALPGTQAPSGYLLVINSSNSFTLPVDGTPVASSASAVNIPYTAADSYTFSGLNRGTNYYFRIYSYNGSTTAINYKTDGMVPALTAMTTGTGGGGGNLPDLIISEYVEGSSYNKAVEIYNGTGAAVDLSAYSLKKQSNGVGAFTNEIMLSTVLADKAVYVLAHTSASTEISARANLKSASINHNGNDAIGLYKNGTLLDMVGVENSADFWGTDLTLTRKTTVTAPNPVYNSAEWNVLAKDDISNLGLYGSSSLIDDLPVIRSTVVLSNYPNPFNPTTMISYQLTMDNYVQLSVYNAKGELVKTLVSGLQSAGLHRVEFNGADFNSGLYFYKLETAGKRLVNRMLLLK